mgnify:CR=1 FL=1
MRDLVPDLDAMFAIHQNLSPFIIREDIEEDENWKKPVFGRIAEQLGEFETARGFYAAVEAPKLRWSAPCLNRGSGSLPWPNFRPPWICCCLAASQCMTF